MTDRPRRKSDAARRANQVIRGRTMLIMLLLGVASFTVLFWKLYDLQINRHDELKAEAVGQQTDSMVISASRGRSTTKTARSWPSPTPRRQSCWIPVASRTL